LARWHKKGGKRHGPDPPCEQDLGFQQRACAVQSGYVITLATQQMICVLIPLNSSLIRALLPRRKQESTMTLEFWIWRERGDFILSDAEHARPIFVASPANCCAVCEFVEVKPGGSGEPVRAVLQGVAIGRGQQAACEGACRLPRR
jgi:hypothetical protein